MASVVGEAESERPIRVFFIPFFATGHMIPMVDIARLFAARGVDSTVLLTPANAALVQPTIDRAAAAGLPLRTLLYPFPSDASGLPSTVENISSLPPSECHKIDAAALLTRPDHDRLLRLHRPDAIVADTHFPWTTAIARDLGIPRLSFHALGLFAVCVVGALFRHLPHLAVSSDDDPFLVPDLPQPIHMVRRELPNFLRGDSPITAAMDDLTEAESGSLGVVVNSFAEIESAYADLFFKTDRMRSWFVGPVALASTDAADLAARGGDYQTAASNRERILSWLDTKKPNSVVYACFGSWSHFSGEQLKEMALGLELAGHAFVWVVREAAGEGWVPEGYERRVEGRGLVIRGWAPQVVLLGHGAVGGFMTHCGWNSVLEGVSAGLPMATWPLSTEQFMNEKLVVEVLKTGVRATEGARRGTAAEENGLVGAAEIGAAVRRMMGEGEDAQGMRRRAREYGEMALAAMKDGGSSHKGLTELIDDIRAWSKKDTVVVA